MIRAVPPNPCESRITGRGRASSKAASGAAEPGVKRGFPGGPMSSGVSIAPGAAGYQTVIRSSSLMRGVVAAQRLTLSVERRDGAHRRWRQRRKRPKTTRTGRLRKALSQVRLASSPPRLGSRRPSRGCVLRDTPSALSETRPKRAGGTLRPEWADGEGGSRLEKPAPQALGCARRNRDRNYAPDIWRPIRSRAPLAADGGRHLFAPALEIPDIKRAGL